MTLIDFGDFKLRFDPKEVRISIDGDMIDIGARRTEEEDREVFALTGGGYLKNGKRIVDQK